MAKIRQLGCCVCGEDAGRFEQHWNRDTGFGVCRGCVDWLKSRGQTDAELLDLYGVEGVNYAPDAGHSTVIDAPITYIPQVRRFTSKPMRDQMVDGYKALQCLRYQCNEGNIPSRPAYTALCEAISEIADEIVQSLAAYSKASWG